MGEDMYEQGREPLGSEVIIGYGVVMLVSEAIGFVIGLLL
jgi:hypothetical protein